MQEINNIINKPERSCSLTLSSSWSLNTLIGTANSPSAPWESGTILESTTCRHVWTLSYCVYKDNSAEQHSSKRVSVNQQHRWSTTGNFHLGPSVFFLFQVDTAARRVRHTDVLSL